MSIIDVLDYSFYKVEKFKQHNKRQRLRSTVLTGFLLFIFLICAPLFLFFFIVLSFYSTCKFPHFNSFTRQTVSRRFNLFKCRKVHNITTNAKVLKSETAFLFVVFYLFFFIASYLWIWRFFKFPHFNFISLVLSDVERRNFSVVFRSEI
jgi:hypothetical protein